MTSLCSQLAVSDGVHCTYSIGEGCAAPWMRSATTWDEGSKAMPSDQLFHGHGPNGREREGDVGERWTGCS